MGRNVLVRADINARLADDGVTVADDMRLRTIVPMAKLLSDRGANVMLCSHFGRLREEVDETDENGQLTVLVKPPQDGGKKQKITYVSRGIQVTSEEISFHWTQLGVIPISG